MELVAYWRVIRKSLWMILLLVLASLAAATIYTLKQPPQYQSQATLLLNPAVPSSLVPYVQVEAASNLADSYTALIRTQSFTDAMLRELPFQMPASQVENAIDTRLVPNTLFYQITAHADTPEKAQQLVSAVLKVFLSQNASQQQAVSSQASNPARDSLRQRLNDKLTYLDSQIKNYQGQIQALEAQPPSTQRDDRLGQLQNQLLGLQEAETSTLVALSQMENTTTPDRTSFLLVDQPQAGKRVPSQLPTNLGLALALSLVVGLGLAFLRDYLDYSIQSPQQVEQVLGLSPAATIGVIGHARMRGADTNQASRAGTRHGMAAGRVPFAMEYPRSPDAESFRSLRTSIQLLSVDKPIKTILVTSTGPDEGKTFTASNLAVVMAQAGKRVILVDTDLRNPSVHKLFGLPNLIGFTTLIRDGSGALSRVAQPVAGLDNLTVIPSGPLPANPSELLNSAEAVQTMTQLAQHADMVIYDSPPAGMFTDPILLATRSDAVVLVIRAGSTRRDRVARVKQSLQNIGHYALLTVLNRVPAREMEAGSVYYRYYQGQGVYPEASNGTRPTANSGQPVRLAGEEEKG